MGQKVMTVRLPADLADRLDVVAVVDRVSTAEAIRRAVDAYIGSRSEDPRFQEELGVYIDRTEKILGRKGEGDESEVQPE